MKGFERILFPVDFSDVSPKIAPWVLMVAKRFNAEIHLLFIARTLEHFVGVYVTPVYIQNFENEIIKGAEKKMELFAEDNFKDHPVFKTKVILGDPAEEILNYVNSEKIDMIIIGTHGRKGIERILFGSVAERVIKMSPVPVLSINPYRIGSS
ncbi:MAG: universal stress protein [Pseudomonadota bacterium]